MEISREEYLKARKIVLEYEGLRENDGLTDEEIKATRLAGGKRSSWIIGSVNGMEELGEENFFFINENGIARKWSDMPHSERAALLAEAEAESRRLDDDNF